MKVGKYDIESELARGGMGVVYKGRTPEGLSVAVKVVRNADALNVLARFERERRLAKELQESDGFVPLLDAGVTDEGPFLVMPFVGGGTLRDRLGHSWTVEETVTLGRALARALGRAHAHGIVHRDLKPENILLTVDGKPLIADLGLAKHFRSGGSSTVALTGIGHMVGTAGYMAPEQVTDALHAGPTADVFALGLILHECLMGRPAFSGSNPADLLANIAECRYEPLRGRRADVPDELCAIIETALAPAPAGRWKDGDALAQALAADIRVKKEPGSMATVLAALAIIAALAFLALTGQRMSDKSGVEPNGAAVVTSATGGR